MRGCSRCLSSRILERKVDLPLRKRRCQDGEGGNLFVTLLVTGAGDVLSSSDSLEPCKYYTYNFLMIVYIL